MARSLKSPERQGPFRTTTLRKDFPERKLYGRTVKTYPDAQPLQRYLGLSLHYQIYRRHILRT